MKRKILALLLLLAMIATECSGVVMPHVHAEEVVDLTAGEIDQEEEIAEEEESAMAQETASEDGDIAAYSTAASLSGELSALAAGEYILVDDVTMTNTINLEGAVCIDLNGYTLKAPENAQAFTGATNASLTVTDSSEEGTGTIQGNGTVETYGGFMTVPYRGGFTMTGGTITGFTTTKNGGLFYTGGERTVVLNDVTVTNNTAANGGVFKVEGNKTTLTINGGTYTGNKATGSGAIIHSNWVDMTITDGTFTGNVAPDSALHLSGKLTMTGGEISGNTKANGTVIKAVHLNAYDYLQTESADDNATTGDFSGNAVIGDNGISLAAIRSNGNGYDAPASTATVHDLTEGASIFSPVELTVSSDERAVYEKLLDTGYLYTCPAEQYHGDWTVLIRDLTALPAGSYCLNGTTTIDETITLSGDVNLCLNGCTLTGTAAPFFQIPAGASLTVCDHGEEGSEGKIAGTGDTAVEVYGGFATVSGGAFTLSSGTITGFNTTSPGGVFYMTGAKSQLNLAGGAITGNKAGAGGVARMDNGTLNISGDVMISANSASSGGAFISYGSRTAPVINISGGTITGNTSSGGGCLQLNGSKLTITGGTITGNASNGATLMLQATDLQMSGGIIEKNIRSNGSAAPAISLGNHYSTHVHSTGLLSGNAVIKGDVVCTDSGEYDVNTCAIQNLSENGCIETSVELEYGDGIQVLYYNGVYSYTARTGEYATLKGNIGSLVPDKYQLADTTTVVSTIEINGEVTIDLNGQSLQGKVAPLFKLTPGSKLTVLDSSEDKSGQIAFTGGRAVTANGGFVSMDGAELVMTAGTIKNFKVNGMGGAIYAVNGSAVELSNVALTNNTASSHGGAVYVNGSQSVLSVTDCEFSGNTGDAGGAIITYNTAVTLQGSTVVTDNTANGGSAVQVNLGSLTITDDTVVTGNYGVTAVAYCAGAALTMNSGEVGDNYDLSGAEASSEVYVGDYTEHTGSAVFSEDALVGGKGVVTGGNAACTVKNLNDGAEVIFAAAAAVTENVTSYMRDGLTVYIPYVEMKNISGTVASLTGGNTMTGNVTLSGTVTVSGNVILDLNGHTLTGKAYPYFNIPQGASLTIRDSGSSGKITGLGDNGAATSGCMATMTGGRLTIEGGTISNFKTTGSGGVVYATAGTIVIHGGTFTENTAANGGVIYNSGADITIDGGSFTSNTASGDASYGGAIYSLNGEMVIEDGAFTSNTSGRGGALAGSNLTIEDGAFTSNSAVYGGVLWVLGSGNVTFNGGTYTGNTASSNSGAIAYSNGAADSMPMFAINGGTFTGTAYSSTSTSDPGASYTMFYLSAHTVKVSGGSISGNTVTWQKKTLWWTDTQTASIRAMYLHNYNAACEATFTGSPAIGDKGVAGASSTIATVKELTTGASIVSSLKMTVGDDSVKESGSYTYTYKPNGEIYKVLIVGNEAARDSAAYLSELALLTGNRIQVGILSKDDASIRDHAYNFAVDGYYNYYVIDPDSGDMTLSSSEMTADTVVAAEQWNAVVLHQQLWSAGYPTTYNADLQYLIDYFTDLAPTAGLFFHMGWAAEDNCTEKTAYLENYASRAAMYNAIIRVMDECIARDDSRYGGSFSGYIPTGAAIEHMRSKVSYTLTRDTMNLSYEGGRLVAAMTMLKTLLPDADLSLINTTGLSDFLSEKDAVTGTSKTDSYTNTAANLSYAVAAVNEAIKDATTGDMIPDLVEQEAWQKNTNEGVITAVQTVAPMKLHFGDVATAQDGTIYLTAYESVVHVMTDGIDGMEEGPGRCLVWKGTADGQSFDMENPLLVFDEAAIEEWGLRPELFSRYQLIKSGSNAQKVTANADPRDPNIVVVYTDVDGDGEKEELLLFTAWIRYSNNSGTNNISTLYIMHSADGGETWTTPTAVKRANGTTVGPKRGDIAYFDDGQILVPHYGGYNVGCVLMEWDIDLQQWVTVNSYQIPDTAPDETNNSANYNEVSLISPDGSDTVYCFTRIAGVVLKSEDRGATWEEIGNEPGPAQQPGFARLDDDTVFVTWSNAPSPRSTYGKTFHVNGDWMDMPTRLIYASGIQETKHDSGDPSCATMLDGKVYVISYDTAYRSIVANIVDPYAEEFLAHEQNASLTTVTMEQAEVGVGMAMTNSVAIDLGEVMTQAHSVRATVSFTSASGSLTLQTRNGNVVVTPSGVTMGSSQAALSLAQNTQTKIVVSVIGQDTFIKVWQGEEPSHWTMEAGKEKAYSRTVLTGSGVTVTDARITCQATLSLEASAQTEAGVGGKMLDYTATPLQEYVVWSSDNACVAKVVDGQVIGVSAGTTTVYMTVGDQVFSCQVTVSEQPNETNGIYERDTLFTDTMDTYAVGTNTIKNDTNAQALYTMDLSSDDTVISQFNIVAEDDGNRYLQMKGHTHLYKDKEHFSTECTTQFDFRFNGNSEVYMSVWQGATGHTCIVHLDPEGIRIHYRPYNSTTVSGSTDNPDLYYPSSGSFDFAKDKMETGVWKTMKVARVDGGCYIKVWNRGEEEPVAWDLALLLDYLDADTNGYFRITNTDKSGVSFDVDNIIVTRNNGTVSGAANTTVHKSISAVAAKAATCGTDGCTAHWMCADCGNVFTDAAGTNMTTVEAVTIGATGSHIYTNKAEEQYLIANATCSSAAVYFKSCSVCGEQGTGTFTYGSPASHQLTQELAEDRYLKSEATCTEPAVYYKSCAVCGGTGTATFTVGTAAGHDYTAEKAETRYLVSAATCEKAAVYYKSCTKCGEAGTETFFSGSTISHSYTAQKVEDKYLAAEATCTAAASYYKSCTMCGKAGTETFFSGSAISHSYTAQVAEDKYLAAEANCQEAASYYKSCTMCGKAGTETFYYGETGDHVFDQETPIDWFLASAATCTQPATYYKTCRCGWMGMEVFSYGEPVSHSYTAKKAEDKYLATEANCQDAATYYKSCSMCGKAGTETFSYGEAGDHVFDQETPIDWFLASAATCTQPAAYYKTCKCGWIGTEVFFYGEPASHTFTAQVAEEKYLASAATTSAAATYYKSCKDCGAAGTEVFSYGEPLAVLIKASSIVARPVLGNAIDFQFGVPKSAVSDWTGCYAVVSKEVYGAEPSEMVLPADKWGEAGPYWAVEYSGMAAKEMNDQITVQIFDGKGNAISEEKVYSIKEYAIKNYGTLNAEYKTLLVDMLNYGAAAQKQFSYDTENLVNAVLTEEQQAMATPSVTVENKQVSGPNFFMSRLILESRIQLQFGFRGTDINADCYAVYTYAKHTGVTVEETVALVAVGGGIYGVFVEDLDAADGRALVDVKVYNADGVEIGSAADSVEGYVARNSTVAINLAIMKYCDAANAALH